MEGGGLEGAESEACGSFPPGSWSLACGEWGVF